MPKFRFHIARTTVSKTDIYLVKSVALVSDSNELIGQHYSFPLSLQPEENHTELMNLSVIKAAKKNMKNYRNVVVTLPEAKMRLYYDDGNFIFGGEFLDECEDPSTRSAPGQANSNSNRNDTAAGDELTKMLTRIRELELKLDAKNRISVKRARDHFAIGEFDGKGDGADYLKKFEAECDRYEIRTEEDKIKILGDFCKGRAATWYSTSERVLGGEWTEWTSSFKATFGQQGWTPVRAAHHFRWLKGSLKDYALEKHRLIAEVDNKIPAKTLIDMIVVGCPTWVQKELKRDELTDLNKLFEALQRTDDPKPSQTGSFKDYKDTKPKGEEKQKEPCQWCAQLGFPKRKHSTEECNLKRKAMLNAKKVNLVDGTEDEAAFLKLINADSDEDQSKN